MHYQYLRDGAAGIGKGIRRSIIVLDFFSIQIHALLSFNVVSTEVW